MSAFVDNAVNDEILYILDNTDCVQMMDEFKGKKVQL